MSPPADIVVISADPAYGITPAGVVWRLSPHRCRRWPNQPHPLTPVMMGSANAKRSPSVKLNGRSRTIASLLREQFPQALAQAPRP